MSDKFDTADIAEYLGVSRPHVTDVLVKQPGFPAPVINRSARMRRWLASDIMAWASGSQAQSREAMSSDVVR